MRPRSKSDLLLRRGAVLSAIAIVIGSVFSFGAIEYTVNVIVEGNYSYEPVYMVYMIGPMSVLIGFITYASYQATNRYLAKLLNAIEKVAARDFSARLDPSAAGSYRDIFASFNSMCDELQGVQTLRDDFINNFSHEFKTPISSISGFARLLLEEKVSDEERRQYLEIIASESERLADMATSALLMTKLDSQRVIVDEGPYSLDEQIKRCAILLSPQWSKKGIDLTAELASATFVGNADLMQHVWINIIGNAIKYTPEGGKIDLRLRQAEGAAVAEIADSGVGMTEEEVEHAFDKYYQGASERSAKGLGLGLAIAKKIVALSGGTIEARSAPGRGSTFVVRLPLGSAPREPSA